MAFNSKKLQACFESVKPILENINKSKDTISEDIRNFEKYLCTINLNESLTFIISRPDENFVVFSSDEYNLTSQVRCTEELLIWNHIKKRLVFFSSEYAGTIHHECFDTPVVDPDSCKSVFNKPLIETPFEVRKYVYENNYLAQFLQMIAKKYDIHGLLNSKAPA